MSSDQHNSIMTKAIGLIFLLFDVALAHGVHTMHSSCALLLFHSSLLRAKIDTFVASFHNKSSVSFIVAALI